MKKIFNKKGFTLMEMLIVVAIIVILVAISIPAFSNSLDSAKKATDAANFRAAKSAFVMQTMNGSDSPLTLTGAATGEDYYYDFNEGKFIKGKDKAVTSGSVGECSKHKNAYITIKDGEVVWSNGKDCDGEVVGSEDGE